MVRQVVERLMILPYARRLRNKLSKNANSACICTVLKIKI